MRRSSHIDTRRDLGLTLAFVIGGVVGALALVPLLVLGNALLQPVPTVARVAGWLVVGAGVVVVNIGTGGCPLLQTRRQIGQEALVGHGAPGAFRFGAALGTGVMTYTPSCAPHLVALSLVLLPVSTWAAVSAAIGFGTGRGIGIIGRALSPDRVRFDRAFQHVVNALARGLAGASIFGLLALMAWRA